MNKLSLLIGFAALSMIGCKTQKEAIVAEIENEMLDTLVVSSQMPNTLKKAEDFKLEHYNPAATQTIDILDINLDLKFDWTKEHVLGTAVVTAKPWFYELDVVELDAKNFDIHDVLMGNKSLKYEYDNSKLKVQLPKTYTRTEEFALTILYTAKPSDRTNIGGSSAITSDKGLFFINADGSDKDKPQQIWTQGETEHNSRWFPTVDKPNERCTQEIKLTVQNRFKTLSNGKRLASKDNGDGTRTDHYKMSKPHAPYLFMVAVGEFSVIEDKWKNIPLEYYVEKPYEGYAEKIFPYTPEMLTFFSNKLGYEYPWDKYSQIVVRDYVSGAMENTSAVIFGEFMQLEEGDLVDELYNEKIVAHEMMHHWFGDLVTCESWANLTLNEGFANYSEYLWLENKHGREEADAHREEEVDGYLYQASTNAHELIYYGYDKDEDMFDAHSYNKGGLVLHMLRDYVGDDAFFAACQKYLQDNEYTQVEVDELRMAFEDVTGMDLNWFFNQWYLAAGHPQLVVEKIYDADAKEVVLKIAQTQNPDKMPAIFQLPVTIGVHIGTEASQHEIMINKREQEFRFPATVEPSWVDFDVNKVLLAELEYEQDIPELLFQLENGKKFQTRKSALSVLAATEQDNIDKAFQLAIKDSFHGLRSFALNMVEPTLANEDLYLKLAKNDPHSEVASMALASLSYIGSTKAVEVSKKMALEHPSNNVRGAALMYLAEMDETYALEAAEKLKDTKSSKILGAVSQIFVKTADFKYYDGLVKNISHVDGEDAVIYLSSILGLASQSGDGEKVKNAVTFLGEVGNADNSHSLWRRYGTIQLLSQFKSELNNVEALPEMFNGVVEQIDGILKVNKTKETNSQLLGIYDAL